MAVDDDFTKVLLHFNGSDESTTITDESGKVWTAHANAFPVTGTTPGIISDTPAQLDTGQKKFGGSSLILGALNGCYIDAPDSADFYFGSGDFCIDCWIMLHSNPAAGAYMAIYSQQADINNFIRLGIYRKADDSGCELRFSIKQAGTQIVELYRDATITLDTWYHIAVTRNGDNWRLFQNGSLLGESLSDSSIAFNIAGSAYIGQRGSDAMYFDGWIDEFRISKGNARWTDSFTPPETAYAPVSGCGEAGCFLSTFGIV